AKVIFCDYAGFSTLDSVVRAKKVFGENHITIISQEFHNQRAIWLAKRYPGTHDYATDKALWQYTQDLKNQFLRNAPPINKVMYDNKIH
ncbi:ElyC/SanA/YdcF family protein, partial [Escherichia coli]